MRMQKTVWCSPGCCECCCERRRRFYRLLRRQEAVQLQAPLSSIRQHHSSLPPPLFPPSNHDDRPSHLPKDFAETVLHNSTWSIEKHTVCPQAYTQLLTVAEESNPAATSAASAPPLTLSIDQSHPPPLPPGWEVLVDSSGRPYYGNPTLRVTQYQHPAVQSVHPHESAWSAQAQQPPVCLASQRDAVRMSIGAAHIELQQMNAVPQLAQQSPWQRCTDPYGRCYRLNTATGETQWEYGNSSWS